jgi:hypothetical protein
MDRDDMANEDIKLHNLNPGPVRSRQGRAGGTTRTADDLNLQEQIPETVVFLQSWKRF